MTTIHREQSTCALCGTTEEYAEVGSTNTFGSPDLDTRPPEMERLTITYWVQQCPACGYCAADIESVSKQAKKTVAGEEYKAVLRNSALPALANRLLCKSMIEHAGEKYSAATWSIVHAAWACDDAVNEEGSRALRIKAVAMARVAKDHGQKLSGQEGADTAVLTDLLRRASELDSARQLIDDKKYQISDDVITRILVFQTRLIEQQDTSCHTIAEAMDAGG